MGCGKSSLAKQAPAAQTQPEAMPEGDFKINLEKMEGNEGLGLTVIYPEKKHLLVQSMKEEGLVPSWNKKNENTPEVQVKSGDLILAINGIFGNTDLMMKEAAAEKCLSLTVKRAAAPATDTAAAEQPVAEPAAEPATEVVAPAAEAPTADVPLAEAPATEAPAVEAGPVPEAAAAEAPAAAEAAAVEVPAAEVLSTEVMATESPALDVPVAEVSVAESPAAEAPAAEGPAVDATEAVSIEPESTEVQPSVAEERLCRMPWFFGCGVVGA